MTDPKTRPALKSALARAVTFTTGTIVAFSFTLLAGSIALLAGLVPLEAMNAGQRIDVGAMLFIAPVLALVLSVIFEAARIAFTREQFPEPRQRQVVSAWAPGRREG